MNRSLHTISPAFLAFLFFLIAITGKSMAQRHARTPDSTRERHSHFDFNTDKLYTGGNIGLGFSSQGGYFNLSPIIGYELTPRWQFALGAIYIYQKFRPCPNCDARNFSMYGWRAFSRYFIFNRIFAHVEYETLNRKVLLYNGSNFVVERQFVPSLFVGGGFTSTSFNSRGNWYLMILYEIIQHPHSLYRQSGNILIKGGFKIGL